MGTTSPTSPTPPLAESLVDSTTFCSFTHEVELHYTHSGTTSLETALRPQFDALKYSTSRVKYA